MIDRVLTKHGRVGNRYLCQCDCGEQVQLWKSEFYRLNSCGCLHSDASSAFSKLKNYIKNNEGIEKFYVKETAEALKLSNDRARVALEFLCNKNEMRKIPGERGFVYYIRANAADYRMVDKFNTGQLYLYTDAYKDRIGRYPVVQL